MPPESPQTPRSGGERRVLAELADLAARSGRIGQAYLDLLALEGRLAGRSVVWMGVAAIALAVLLITVWLSLAVALALYLSHSGVMSPPGAALIAGGVNLVLAGICWLVIRRMLRNLTFPEFRAALAELQHRDPPA